jgi:hypothetical protein
MPGGKKKLECLSGQGFERFEADYPLAQTLEVPDTKGFINSRSSGSLAFSLAGCYYSGHWRNRTLKTKYSKGFKCEVSQSSLIPFRD